MFRVSIKSRCDGAWRKSQDRYEVVTESLRYFKVTAVNCPDRKSFFINLLVINSVLCLLFLIYFTVVHFPPSWFAAVVYVSLSERLVMHRKCSCCVCFISKWQIEASWVVVNAGSPSPSCSMLRDLIYSPLKKLDLAVKQVRCGPLKFSCCFCQQLHDQEVYM